MRIVIQLIENYLKQEVPTVYITTDTNKYLFNVPSSFQRFTKQHKNKFPAGARFFFTKTNTNTITGLTGLILTMFHSKGVEGVKLYTDEKMFRYMEELRYKMGFKAGPISYCSWQGKLRKGIQNLQLLEELSKREDFAEIFNKLNEYIDDNLSQEQQNNAMAYFNKQTTIFKDEEMEIQPFFVQENGQLITNYIIIPGALPGRLLPEKLKEFGISGLYVSALTKDGFVDIGGRIIKEEEVRQPATPSPTVILLHYKEKQTIHKILKDTRLTEYVQDKKNFVYAVIHIVQESETVLSHQFRGLLSSFSPEAEHLVYNNRFRNSNDSIEDLARVSAQVRVVSELHKLFPMCMPNLVAQNKQYVQDFVAKTEAIDLMFPEHKIRAYKRIHELVVAPKKSWGYKRIGGADKKQSEFNMDIEVPQPKIELQEEYKSKFEIINPKVVFLGTGSMKPSKYRNVSSILVEWEHNSYIMMDCGQGSHIQLIEHYGHHKYEEVLLGLRIIFITHIHSDHNLGILDTISERIKILKKRSIDLKHNKIFLILPANVVPWYNSFCKNVEDLNEGCNVIFIQSLRNEEYSFEGTMSKQKALNRVCSVKSQMVEESQEDEEDQDQLDFINPEWDQILRHYFEQQQITLKEFQEYLGSVGIDQFYPCPVIHCPQSYGICIRHQSGVKVSYSGDTRPCEEFAQAACNSTILIHEATHGDDLAKNAETHFHSTVGEAIDMYFWEYQRGMKSKSWKLALTHFSQRYKSGLDIVEPKNYWKNKPKKDYATNHTIVCFDHLQILASKAHLMPEYSRAISAAIPKDKNQ